MICGLLIGYAIFSIVAITLQFSTVTIFICFDIDPNSLEAEYPKYHKKLTKSWEKWQILDPFTHWKKMKEKLLKTG